WNNHPLGFVRTYARLRDGESFTYASWVEAVRAGRTFVTKGPLLRKTVDGHESGAIIQLKQPTTVHVHAEARSLEPFDHLALVHNGEFLKSVRPRGSPFTAVIDRDVKLRDNGWLSLWCSGDTPYIMTHGGQMAVASPVYIRFKGTPLRADPEAVCTLLSHLDQMLNWVHHQGRFENDRQGENLAGIFESAREVLRQRSNLAAE